MALNSLGMGIVFTASDLASSVIRQLSSNFLGLDQTVGSVSDNMAKRLGVSTDLMVGSLKRLGLGIATAAVGMTGLKASFSLAKPAGEFEQAIAGIGAISGATAEQLAILERAAIDAGIATQFSPQEAAQGLQILAQAGLQAEQSIKALTPVLDLAAASLGQLSLEESGGLAIASMKVFPEVANDTAEAMNLLVRSTSRSNLQFRDLPLALGIAARGAKIFNASMEDTLIALGEIRNVIPTVERGATSVASAMELLAMPKVQKQLDDLGVKVRTLDGKNFRPFLEVMADTAKAFNQMGGDAERGEKLLEIFGRRGVAGLKPLLEAINQSAIKAGNGVADYAKAIAAMREQMRTARISAASFRDQLLDTFEGQKTLLRGTLETIAIAIGKPFAQVLKPIVGGVVDTLNFMLRAILALPEPVKRFMAALVIAGSAAASIIGVVIAVKALIPLLTAAAGLIGGGVLLAFGKVLLVIGAVTAAVFALKSAWDSNFAGIRDLVLPTIERVSLALQALFGLLGSGEISGKLAEDLMRAENRGILHFVTAISNAFAVVQSFVTGFAEGFISAFQEISVTLAPVMGDLGEAFGDLFDSVMSLAQPVLEMLGFKQGQSGIETVRTLGRWVGWLATGPLKLLVKQLEWGIWVTAKLMEGMANLTRFTRVEFGGLAGIIGGAFEALLGLLTGNFDAVFEGITRMVNGVIDIVNGLMSKAATALRLLGARETAIKLERSRIAHVRPEKIAFALGASNETVQGFIDRGNKEREDRDQARSGVEDVSLGAAPVSGGGTRELPPSAPVNQGGGGGLSQADVMALVEAAVQAGVASERGRPIVVQGEVTIDGRRLGSMQAQQARDSRARGGRVAGAFGG